jgi:two-component system LytT family sensor kinase
MTLSALTRPLLQPPPGMEPLRARLLVLGFWVVLGAMETAKEFTAGRLQPSPRTLAEAVIVNFPWWFFWAFGTLAVIHLARRWPVDRERPLLAAVWHTTAALAIAGVHLSLVAVLGYLAIARGGNTAGADVWVQIRFWLEAYIVLDFFVYWMVLGAYHALLYHQRYLHGTLREAEARAQAMHLEAAAAAARLQALQMELNPHFLFNSLNAVSGLVDEGRNREATTVIARLARLLRLTLHRGHERHIELARELEYIQLYLAMEQVRFGPRLRFEIAAEDGVLHALVPPMILQPLVENAIRHGAAMVTGPSVVRVSARRDGHGLLLGVTDDGPGLHPAIGQTGTGLSNIRERLFALYGGAASMSIAPGAEGKGVRAGIRLPLLTNGAEAPEPVNAT